MLRVVVVVLRVVVVVLRVVVVDLVVVVLGIIPGLATSKTSVPSSALG